MYINENKNLLLRIIGLVIVIAVIATIATAIGAVSAASDIYVSPEGNDVNSGSDISPKATINASVEVAENNGKIILKDGKYNGTKNTNIIISKNLTIVGENVGKVIIDGSAFAKMFIITEGNALTLINITFINGSDVNGGAIYNDGTLNIQNCEFINNTATYGGAIYTNKGQLNIYETRFVNNTANYDGAIHIQNGNVTISNSTFTSNNATTNYGCAISIYNGNVTIDNSTFTSNNAASLCGAILIMNGNVNISNCTLINNTSTNSGGGGAIFIVNGNATIANCTFINNTATTSGGGAIFIQNGDVSISNCTFINNTASTGGVIHIHNGNVVISICTFINNTASPGGAIYIINGDVSVSNCTFINNTASDGGAIFINGNCDVSFSNCTFINNTAALGGAIFINTGNLGIANSRIYNNSAASQVYCARGTVIANSNWWGTNTPTTSDYNAITQIANYFVASATFDGTDIIYSFHLNNNPSIGGSGLPEFNMSITNSSGDIVYTGDARVSQTYMPRLSGSYTVSVDGFEATGVYDVLYVSPNGNDVSNSGRTPDDPLATIATALAKITDGGIIYLMEGTHTEGFRGTGGRGIAIDRDVNIIGVEEDNVILDARKSGRHFNITGPYTVKFQNIILINGLLIGSGYDGWGGAIFINNDSAVVEIVYCTFINNTVVAYGGAIGISSGDVNISNCIFTNNKADYDGGAIYICNTEVNISNCIFTNNAAISYAYGGAIGISSGDVNISNCIFTNNSASDDGGAIIIYNGNVTISNCIFTNNTATNGDGGAIYMSNGNLNIGNSTFTNSTSTMYGGAIFIGDGNVTIGNSTFINNTATYYGGAICINNDNVTIGNSTFTSNTATQGGAIFINSGNVTISYSRIYNNLASHSQVYVDGGTVTANSNWWGNNTPVYGRDYTGTITIANYFVASAAFDGTNLNYRFHLSNDSSTDGSGLPEFEMSISLGGNIVETGDARVSQTFTPSVSSVYTLSVDGYSMIFEAIIIPPTNISNIYVSLSTGKKVLEVGDIFNLIATVTNLGPDKSSFVLTVKIPKGMKFVSAKATKGTVTYREGVVYWEVFNLDPKYADVLLNPAGDLAPYQALLDITLKVLKPGKFTFKYNVEGVNTVVNVKGDVKLDLIAIKKNGTNHNDTNKNKTNKTKYKHGHSGMMKTAIPVQIAILALIAIFFSIIGIRRKKRD
jgi:predicted outer membrane repeat protein